ncbi:hypothetical protein GOODEAATRI_023276 [Goodea atripinnis]|uniref:Uncharacterized protein n=1 Tax=Goodea atripinnis TaxID=208336 RepID=A0ABV0PRG0_9TELE
MLLKLFEGFCRSLTRPASQCVCVCLCELNGGGWKSHTEPKLQLVTTVGLRSFKNEKLLKVILITLISDDAKMFSDLLQKQREFFIFDSVDGLLKQGCKFLQEMEKERFLVWFIRIILNVPGKMKSALVKEELPGF